MQSLARRAAAMGNHPSGQDIWTLKSSPSTYHPLNPQWAANETGQIEEVGTPRMLVIHDVSCRHPRTRPSARRRWWSDAAVDSQEFRRHTLPEAGQAG
jgi:hypothetical protein